jgi:hypothetical protein
VRIGNANGKTKDVPFQADVFLTGSRADFESARGLDIEIPVVVSDAGGSDKESVIKLTIPPEECKKIIECGSAGRLKQSHGRE